MGSGSNRKGISGARLNFDPGRSETYQHFCPVSALAARPDLEEAIKQLRMAVKADPLSPTVHYTVANVLISAGRLDKAATLREAAGRLFLR